MISNEINDMHERYGEKLRRQKRQRTTANRLRMIARIRTRCGNAKRKRRSMNHEETPGVIPQMITAREVCARLNISTPTLYRAIQRGHLPPPVKIGVSSRWRLSEILAVIDCGADA